MQFVGRVLFVSRPIIWKSNILILFLIVFRTFDCIVFEMSEKV